MTSLVGRRIRPRAEQASSAAAIAAVLLASTLLPFAVTGPAVILPDLAAGLHASPPASQWVQNAYNTTFAAAVLAAGSLADRLGRRRVLRAGIAVFALAAAGIAVAPDALLVDVLRAAQGFGAAGIIAAGAAVLAHATSGPRRVAVFGMLGASFGAGLAFAPLAAGALGVLGWRAVFVAIAVLAAVSYLASRRVIESRDVTADGLDVAGMTVFGAALLLLSLGFVSAASSGWAALSTLGCFAAVVGLLVLFVVVELRNPDAMFDVRLFMRPAFTAVVCQPFVVTFGFVILLVYLPLYLQGVSGLTPFAAAAALLPMTAPVLLVPMAAGRLVGALPVRTILVTASLLIAVGSLGLVLLTPTGSWWRVAGPLLLFGLGVGAAFTVMDNAAVSTVPVEKAGAAAGMFNTMRIAGESFAVAAAAAVLTTLTAAHAGLRSASAALQGAATDTTTDAAFTAALHTVVIALAILALTGSALTALALRPSRDSSSPARRRLPHGCRERDGHDEPR